MDKLINKCKERHKVSKAKSKHVFGKITKIKFGSESNKKRRNPKINNKIEV